MFGKKKMYKKGLADAMRAYEEFGKKQEAALEHMREEVRSGNKKLEDALTSLGDDLNGIYKYLNSKEKDVLYHLSTPMDIRELEEKEQRLLLAVLYQLAEDEGDALTDDQRSYIRSVQRYMGITNPQTFADFSAIENIDSIDVQKTFLRVALEFFYLQDGDELSDAQEEFFDYFSVNKKQATVIENEVSRLFNAVGAQGMAEKYGYVPEKEPEIDSVTEIENNGVLPENILIENDCVDRITGEFVDEMFNSSVLSEHFVYWLGIPRSRDIYETSNYIMYDAHFYDSKNDQCKSGRILFKKRTGEKNRLNVDISHDEGPWIDGDKVFFFRYDKARKTQYGYQGDVWVFDLSTLRAPEKLFPISNYHEGQLSIQENYIAFIDDGMPYLYSIDTKKLKKIQTPTAEPYDQAIFAASSGVYLYNDPNHTMYFYDYSTQDVNFLFSTYDHIREIYHVEGGKIYFKWGNWDSKCGMIDLSEIQERNNIEFSSDFDLMMNNPVIHSYHDCLVYVAEGGIIKKLNYRTGEVEEIATDAKEHHHDSGGLFKKGYSYYTPVDFRRIGNWICYRMNADYNKPCRVLLSSPGEVELIRKYSDEEHSELLKSISNLPEIEVK